MTVFGPDGKPWSITRRSVTPGLLAGLLPGGAWVVEAVASDETRRWQAASRRAAGSLVTQVALAVRTGAPSPAGELAPEADDRDAGSRTPPGEGDDADRGVPDVAGR